MRDRTGSESSRDRRFLAGLPATVHYREVDYPCRAHDLSRSGVLLRGGIPWPAEGRAEFTLRSGHGDVSVRLEGTVARIGAGDAPDETELALTFDPPDERARPALEALLARLVEGQWPAALDDLPAGAPDEAVRSALESVPLAHRVGLALRAGPRERDILRRDSAPQVLDALARNPTLLPSEARALAGLPNLSPAALRHLVNHPNRSGDETLRHLVVTHPHTPLDLAEGLVSEMADDEIRRLSARPGVPPAIRAKLTRRLSRRR